MVRYFTSSRLEESKTRFMDYLLLLLPWHSNDPNLILFDPDELSYITGAKRSRLKRWRQRMQFWCYGIKGNRVFFPLYEVVRMLGLEDEPFFENLHFPSR